jgi:hypothetical protein
MKNNVMLTIASLLSLLFMTFHLTDDALRQHEGAIRVAGAVLIFVVWVCGTLLLSGRALGYVITLLGGLAAAGMIVLHSPGGAVNKAGGFFFIWTMFILSITGWLTAILSAGGLWMAFRARQSKAPAA